MIDHCREITQELKLKPVPCAEVETLLESSGEARVWRDLQVANDDELEEKLDLLGVTGLSRRLCLEARNRPGFYPLKDEIVFVIPLPPTDKDILHVSHLAFVCRKNCLLTIHDGALPELNLVAELEGEDSWLPARSIAGLVAAMMIHLSQEYLRLEVFLRERILNLEEQMNRDTEDVEVEDILDLRAKLVTLGTIVYDHGPPLKALSQIDKPFFELHDTREFLFCALANQQAADGALTWLDQRISSLRSGVELHAQDKTNRRLNTLTVLSAIFNPITLLAGIWGMNFVKMPELQFAYGYPIALAIMVGIGVLIFLYFKKTGWLD